MSEFKYDIPVVAEAFDGGTGVSRDAIRGWIKQKRITGAWQREPNAKFWLSAEGVAEAWGLWANHNGLDPFEVPPAARKMIEDGTARPSPSDADSVVTIIVPAGVTVKVVQHP